MTVERTARMEALRKQALKSIGARANNKNEPGVSMVSISPHDALKLLEAVELLRKVQGEIIAGSRVEPDTEAAIFSFLDPETFPGGDR